MQLALGLLGLLAALSTAAPTALEPRSTCTATTPPKCSYVTNPNKPTGIICNRVGELTEKSYPLGPATTQTTIGACSGVCFANTKCKGFGFNSQTKSCQLYSQWLYLQGCKADPSSHVTFSNRNCLVAQCDAVPPVVCADKSNQGIQYAVYDNVSGDNEDETYSNFDPTIYKTLTPKDTGTTSSIGGFIETASNTQINPYNGNFPAFSSNEFVLNHRGYFYPTLTGAYNISVTSADDIAEFWIGSTAYSGWTRPNAALDVPYAFTEETPGNGSMSITLTAGQLYPFRIVYANAQTIASFGISIVDPNLNTVVDSTSGYSSQVIQYSCNKGCPAPPFKPFGSEK